MVFLDKLILTSYAKEQLANMISAVNFVDYS